MSLTLNKTKKFAVLDLSGVKQQVKGAETKSSSTSSNAISTTGRLRPLDNLDGLYKSTLSVDEKVALAVSVGEEVVTEDELRALFTAKEHPIVYDGFEPSGRMHIAQGILRAINVNKLTKAGCLFKFWVADWFAQLNNKMDGDLNKIKIVGQYMIEIWKAVGMDMRNVRFLWASDEINSYSDEYWSTVMDIARVNNLPRIKRCCTIMGREDSEAMPASQIFYPCMQCADVFFFFFDI